MAGWKNNDIVHSLHNILSVDISTKRYPHTVMYIEKRDWIKLQPIIGGIWVVKHGKRLYAQTWKLSTGKSCYIHQLIVHTEIDVDHIDGNGLNNVRSNLRSVTRAQNLANQRKTRGTSKYKGVCWCTKFNKWKAQISHNGKTNNLGLCDDEKMAARIYDAAAITTFGKYACTNFQQKENQHDSTNS